MLFNSFAFVAFFPVVVGLYFVVPYRWRWALLLAASYVFYAWWRIDYLLLILASTLVDYWAGVQMGKRAERRDRLPFLLLSLAGNLGLLFVFKYLGLFTKTAQHFVALVGADYSFSVVELLLPVGISFYTFQTLAYTIDVFRGRKEPERHLGLFALYVSFFPQLVAGPIERSQRLLPQFRQAHRFDEARIADGLRMMLVGFFIKCVVADRLAPYVDVVYANPSLFSGPAVWAATYAFAFQIYGDFAGYSLIAIGSARVMGFELMDNFRRPYLSQSIAEFWRRWHISLSTWFRDYVYIPLGGNRVALPRWYANLMIVFAVSGLWHGAAWTFVIWGALHGLYLVVGAATQRVRDRLWSALEAPPTSVRFRGLSLTSVRAGVATIITFHLVVIAWVFFRAEGLGHALVLVRHAMGTVDGTYSSLLLPGNDGLDLFLVGSAVVALVGLDLLERKRSVPERLAACPWPLRWGCYVALIVVILVFGAFGETTFIYFQF